MSLDTYANVKAEIANHLDFAFSDDDLDTLLDLAEARINRDLRVQAMVATLSGTISAGQLAVPADFREWAFVYVGTPAQALEPRPIEWILQHYPTRSLDSRPRYIARVGSVFEFGPFPDSDYAVTGAYYASFPALSAAAPTNWLTTDAPDLLFFAALEAACRFNRDEGAATWAARYEGTRAAVMREDTDGRYPRQSKLGTRLG